jgi:hypothetical protein
MPDLDQFWVAAGGRWTKLELGGLWRMCGAGRGTGEFLGAYYGISNVPLAHARRSARDHGQSVHLSQRLTFARRPDPAPDKRRAAERLLADAKAEEFSIYLLAKWVQTTADDYAFGRQPAPVPQAPPRGFGSEQLNRALERPWHKARPTRRTAAATRPTHSHSPGPTP